MTHKGENYSVKMQKYYFCNGTLKNIPQSSEGLALNVDGIVLGTEDFSEEESSEDKSVSYAGDVGFGYDDFT